MKKVVKRVLPVVDVVAVDGDWTGSRCDHAAVVGRQLSAEVEICLGRLVVTEGLRSNNNP